MLIASKQSFLNSIGRFRFLKLILSKKRNNINEILVQLSEIKLIDKYGNTIEWGEYMDGNAYVNDSIRKSWTSNEGVSNLFDYSLNTKLTVSALDYTKNYPAIIIIDLGYDKITKISDIVQWQWYTANDMPDRDPVSFSLYVSLDNETYFCVDSVENANITTTRRALAYTGHFSLK